MLRILHESRRILHRIQKFSIESEEPPSNPKNSPSNSKQESKSIVSLSPSLTILTIVLNGMPFIQRHLPIFEQLSPEIDWEWHVVEGVALGRADSRRPYSSRSMEDSHRQYRSKDGTSEYLDYIVSLPNSRVVLYRKPLGKRGRCLR